MPTTTMRPIVFDYNNMLDAHLGGRGLAPARLDALAERFRTIHGDVSRERQEGRLGFFALPDDHDVVERIRAYAAEVEGRFDDIVILGIGGSALGTVALREALLPPRWNELDASARGGRPRLHVLDNVDPSTIAPLLDRLDLSRTLFDVVSKSGTTAETMAQFLIVRDRLARALGAEYRRNLVFTTD